MNFNTSRTYNIFLIPFLISFILFSYIFIAIINSGYFYQIRVLVLSVFLVVVWLGMFIFNEITSKTFFKFSISKIIIIIIGLFLGFYYVKHIWFVRYLSLDPLATFLEGESHVDTLFHADIAESFLTNGYPSIQFNNSDFLHYHIISHFIIAVISKFVGIPCFITYNLLYPIIFIPLYIFLIQYVVFRFRQRFNIQNPTPLKDVFFLVCYCLGFNFLGLADKGHFWYDSIIVSESHLIAIIFMLICFVVLLTISTNHPNVSFFIFVPLLLFITSGAKISVGLILYLICCYILFRNNPLSFKNIFLILLYTILFFVFYKFFNNSFNSSNSDRSFFLLHFLRTYVPKRFWLLHYFIYFVPVLFMFKYKKVGKLFSTQYFMHKVNVWLELAFLLTIGSWLPGLFFLIDGGSAEYFCLPAFISTILLFWGLNVHCDLYDSLKKNTYSSFLMNTAIISLIVSIFSWNLFSIAFLCLIFLCFLGLKLNHHIINNLIKKYFSMPIIIIILLLTTLFIPELRKIEIKNNVHETITLSNKKSLNIMSTSLKFSNRFSKLLYCFNKSDYINDERYNSIKTVRQIVEKNPSDYCLFMMDDCYLYDLYGMQGESSQYYMKPDFAAACIFGLPVINALYIENSDLCRGDGMIIPIDKLNYGINSVNAFKSKLNFEQYKELARNNNKKYLIVLHANTFYIEDL